jgi:iron complex outermembrane recepter protein
MRSVHNRTTCAWMACAILILAGIEAAVVRAQKPAALAGSVLDATGLPLPGAEVTLRGSREWIMETDAAGRFDVQNLPEGEYELTSTRRGFVSSHQVIRLAAGQTTTVTVMLTVLMLEQTVVTAEKAGEADVQTTPMAVTVLTGTQLARLQDRTIEDLASRVPAVTFSQNTGLAQLTIRGIGTNAVFAGSDPSSAVYLDGVYLARPAMALAELFDLDRVEVLRGPQGTLYGRNSLGGAINLISKAPTDRFDASVQVGGGERAAFRTAARVSGPILKGRLMGSAAIVRSVRSGAVRDLDRPDHPLGGEDVIAARGQLRMVFTPRSELQIAGDVSRRDQPPVYYSKILAVKPGFAVDNPEGFYDVRTSVAAEGQTFQSGVAARFTWDLTPALRLTSLSAFRTLDFDVVVDGDASELDLDISRVHDIQHQLSEEVTIAHRTPKLTWIAGAFLFGEVHREPSSTVVPDAQLEFQLEPRVAADASAVFGQASVSLTSRLSAIAGVRYTHERKTIDNAGGLYTVGPPAAAVSGTAYAYSDAIAHDAWTPKIGLDLRATENLLVYASVARGFKSGGFNATSTAPGRGYGPEWAWSYEGGLKAALRDGRARVNLAAFLTDYTDLQVQTPITTTLLDVSNAAAATIRGVELEGATLLGSRTQVGGHLAWLDATYDRYVAIAPGNVGIDVAGHRLNNTPEWSGRIWIEWTRAIGRGYALSLRGDSTWKTTVFFTPFNDRVQQQRPLGLLDASVELGPTHRRWVIEAYGRNLTNEPYITGTNSAPLPAIGSRPGEPRLIGVQLTIGR